LANVAVPPLVGRVVDQTGTLSSSDVATLNQTLRSFEARKGSQIAVLIVPSTDGEAIEQFSLRVAETWKIGRKKIDDGALVVVAKNDRHLRIEVGYGLEGALTDVTSKRIIDEIITPRFRSGDFTGGISAGVDRIIRIVDGEKLPGVEPQHWQPPASGLLNHIDPVFALFVLFGFGAVMRNLLGALLGATVTGGIVGALAWYISGSVGAALLATFMVFMMALVAEILAAANQGSAKGRRGRSGWGDSSSSSGSSWSSGSSSSSSDSSSSSSDSGGGGGSFGGGGASGSW
jgi:uncharacterized protein